MMVVAHHTEKETLKLQGGVRKRTMPNPKNGVKLFLHAAFKVH